MWGAANKTAMVAIIVKAVKVSKHRRSSTMAANFQSFSMAAVSSSSRILSVITLNSLRIRLSSRKAPGGKEVLSSPPEAEELRPGSVGNPPALGTRANAFVLLWELFMPPPPGPEGWAWLGWWGWMCELWGRVEEGLGKPLMFFL